MCDVIISYFCLLNLILIITFVYVTDFQYKSGMGKWTFTF